MMKLRIVVSLLFFPLSLMAQFTGQDVRNRLELIHSGKGNQVKNELSTLMSQYPNDPGVKYLDACLTESGDNAVKKYQAIVDQYPTSEWADDALYKVYQYYYAVALYKTADAKMKQLNEQYPNSIFANRTTNPDEKTTIPLGNKSEVTTEQPASTTETVNAPASQSTGGRFAVQVGVYSQEATAQQQAHQFSQTVGRQATIFPKQSGGKTLYAVAFEGFENEQAARTFGGELKSKFNLDWFLVKR